MVEAAIEGLLACSGNSGNHLHLVIPPPPPPQTPPCTKHKSISRDTISGIRILKGAGLHCSGLPSNCCIQLKNWTEVLTSCNNCQIVIACHSWWQRIPRPSSTQTRIQAFVRMRELHMATATIAAAAAAAAATTADLAAHNCTSDSILDSE